VPRPTIGDERKLKIALTQDVKIHERAVRLARRRGLSLSGLVEALLRTELDKDLDRRRKLRAGA
jgi:hypothetical protein